MITALQSIHTFRPGARYNAAETKRASDILYDEFGNGQAWIHPGFSRSYLYHPVPGRVDPPRSWIDKMMGPDYTDLKQAFPEAKYNEYCERVRQKLQDCCFPLLVFIDSTVREQTLEFLEAFPVNPRLAIEVPTHERWPTPWWGEPMTEKAAWYELARTLSKLEFSTIHMMGELGYIGYGAQHEGCVYGAANMLRQNGFSVATEQELIFPGRPI